MQLHERKILLTGYPRSKKMALLLWLMGTFGVLMSVPGQTIGVSVFTDSLIDALSISRDQLSFAYMFGTILSSLMLTRAGKLYDRIGIRLVASGASLMLGLALIYLSLLILLLFR